jgi:hypothetical protein
MKRIKRIKEWLSKSINLTRSGFLITVLTLILAIVLPLIQNHVETKRKRNLIDGENLYNSGLLKKYIEVLHKNALDSTVFYNQFSVEIYKYNWDIIIKLKPNCAEAFIRTVAMMDAINYINRSIITLYNQEGLISDSNQWKNTKEREAEFYKDLNKNLNELGQYLIDLKGCKY